LGFSTREGVAVCLKGIIRLIPHLGRGPLRPFLGKIGMGKFSKKTPKRPQTIRPYSKTSGQKNSPKKNPKGGGKSFTPKIPRGPPLGGRGPKLMGPPGT